MKIAVFMRDSELCPFFEANSFGIFSVGGEGLQKEREERFEPISKAAAQELRNAASALLALISDCEIIAGGTLAGLAFTVFAKAGMSIYEIAELSDTALLEILADARCDRERAGVLEQSLSRPSPTGEDGVYFLDLAKLQAERPDVSSKMALREFLESSPFLELRLDCRHVPPWLESDEAYQIDAHLKGEGVCAIIRKRRR
jgi:predicted Fe-Mo cluster-binding NifX family protein